MKISALSKAAAASADPARARHFVELLTATSAGPALKKVSSEQARLLAALLAGSETLGNALVAHPDWLKTLDIEALRFPRREQGLRNEVAGWLEAAQAGGDFAAAAGRLREFKHREWLRIAARDLARLGKTNEIIQELSDVADVCLTGIFQICLGQLTARFGRPWHQDAAERWQRTEFCVLGLGKLGGQELNFSSDVDLMFLYTAEGEVFPSPPGAGKKSRATLSNHQFFVRLAEAFIAEVTRVTPEGALFRMDLRLRPEGDAGPLCRSLDSYENYYSQWGQTWERLMLIKARPVAGDTVLGAEFLEMIQSFRYPRAVGADLPREIGAMKRRIEAEVVRAGELERNVKLGRGGIREIEFIAQAQQVLQGGRQPFLQGTQTVPTLEKLARYRLLSHEDTWALRDAYFFLRDVEHRLQMDGHLQTHTIPAEEGAHERLARQMGCRHVAEFEELRRTHTDAVRRIFERVVKAEPLAAQADAFPREFVGAEERWKQLLAEHSFRDPEAALRVLREFVEGPGFVHVSARTVELARKLLPKLLAWCPWLKSETRDPKSKILSDPDRVVTRLDQFIAAYGSRAMLFEMWHSHPDIFELLVLLFDRSEFLAEEAIHTPDLVDELVISGRLRQRKTAEETLRDLRHGLADADQHLWLRKYHQVELMRIGLRDILGLADPEQYLTELSALADACLQHALAVALRRHRRKSAPFVIIGLGKLGGAEIDYGSDLDLLFVADDGAKDLPKLQAIALEVMDLLSRRTEQGIVFHTDARLRPDGEKGLLVNTLGTYAEYYRRRAQLWEIQSLTRTRPVAGDFKLGEHFQTLAVSLTDFKKMNSAPEATRLAASNLQSAPGAQQFFDPPGIACYEANWKVQMYQMRRRIEYERTPAGQDELAIKTGRGGLMDVEFIAQALCLEHGWQEPNTLRALESGRNAGTLQDADALIQNYRALRRVEGVLRCWSCEGETVLPDEPAPFYRVAVRCGFETPEQFRQALGQWRREIRKIFAGFFPEAGGAAHSTPETPVQNPSR